MKVLLVAPEISNPLSEGRKKFVLELLEEFGRLGSADLLTTHALGEQPLPGAHVDSRACKTGWPHLASLIWRTPGALRRRDPDAVLLFPYGSFRGLYRLPALLFILVMRLLFRLGGRRHLTVMYALDGGVSPASLARWAGRLAMNADAPGVSRITIGTAEIPRVSGVAGASRNLLFMAGMWQPTRERLEHVLCERGLAQLLALGDRLRDESMRLIVAVPLLADEGLRSMLRLHPANRWPEDLLEIRARVEVPDVFREVAVYVFPYAGHLNQFTPTSILEALLAGVPVVCSDQPFLLEACRGLGPAVRHYRTNDAESLHQALRAAVVNPRRAEEVQESRRIVLQRFSPSITAREIVALLGSGAA